MSENVEAAWGSIQYALVTRPPAQAEKFNELVRAYGEAKRQEALWDVVKMLRQREATVPGWNGRRKPAADVIEREVGGKREHG